MSAAALLLALLASTGSAPSPGCDRWAEVPPPPLASGAADLARLAELEGRTPLRLHGLDRRSARWTTPVCLSGAEPSRGKVPRAERLDLEVRPAPATLLGVFHSAYADDRNDGALWGGRGLSSSLSLGAEARWRWLSAAVAPLAAWQQNRGYALPAVTRAGASPYANPFMSGVDLPLRFGPGSFWTFTPGQSYVRADVSGVAVGLSTENLWWGPGQRNSLLLSNSAEGFPHLFLGTSGPVDVRIGWLEAELFWGRLRHSRWFDADPGNDLRLLTGLAISYEPRWVPGLSFGLVRVYDRIRPPGGLGLRDYFTPLLEPFLKEQVERQGNPDERAENQLLSVTARWAFPAVGFEVYGEFGRDDHSWDFQDLLMEPRHGSATLWGLQKLFGRGDRGARVAFESVRTFEVPGVGATRPTPIFYTHTLVPTGYTFRGQMIGAGVGPQADSQWLAADLLTRSGRVGLWAERLLRNERFFQDNVRALRGHDAEIAVGLRGVQRLRRGPELEWEVGRAFRYQANFAGDAASWVGRLMIAWAGGGAAAVR